MATLSIERIRDWLSKNRNQESYAFTSIEIALAIGAPRAEVDLLCEGGADSGMIAAVYFGNTRFYTHTSVGLEAQIGAKKLTELAEHGSVKRVGSSFEWTPQRVVRASVG